MGDKMFFNRKFKNIMGGYLLSSNFKNLCEALDFLPEDVDEIKQEVYDLEDKSNIEESIALIIYNHIQKYKNPSKEITPEYIFHLKLCDDLSEADLKYFYQVYIRNPDKWEDIRNKLTVGVKSGKINTEYLFEKEFKQELDLISNSRYDDALISIYLHEINFLLNSFNISRSEKHFLFKDACLNVYPNPLFFDDVKQKLEETVKIVINNPLIQIKEFSKDDLWVSYMIVKDKKIANFIDEFFEKKDEEYDGKWGDCLFTFPSYFGTEMVFFVITCGDIRAGFKKRTDFSKIFIIKKDLIDNSEGILINQRSELAKCFEGYIDENFRKHDLELKKLRIGKYKDLGFKMGFFKNPKDGKVWHFLDVLDDVEEDVEYDHEDLYDIISQAPLSDEFLGVLSSLNFSIDYGYEIQKTSKDKGEALYMLNRKIVVDKNYNRDRIPKEDLLSQLDEYQKKFILKFKEDKWDEIKEEFTSKINSNQIKSSFDLQWEIGEKINSNFKLNILNAQIEALINFRELDNSYSEKLAYYLRDKDILNNGLAEYLNELTKLPEIKQKKYLDEGKFAAPRWLVYPNLARGSMGWRMGYGETYNLNEPWPTEEFEKLFPKPQNWLFNPYDVDFDRFPILGIFWRENGVPKYSELTDDSVEVNDFITIEQIDSEFSYNAMHFKSIEHAILAAKYGLSDKIDYYNTSLNTLKRGFDLTKDEIKYWQNFKYSVCLNAAYYKFMQDEKLKQKLLDTGEKSLVYISDDEWGGYANLFGFALMELRDEIRRLYENEDLIDWEYTEYLKVKNPYETDAEERNLKFVRSLFG